MTQETAERAAELLFYLKDLDAELKFWQTASGIKEVVVNHPDGTRTIDGHFDFYAVREARVKNLKTVREEWEQQLKNL